VLGVAELAARLRCQGVRVSEETLLSFLTAWQRAADVDQGAMEPLETGSLQEL